MDHMSPRSSLTSSLLMLVSAACMSIVGVFVRLMPISVYGAVEFRALFGCLWITIIMIVAGKLETIKQMLPLKKKLVAFSLINSLVIMLYFLSIDLAGLSVAAFLLYLGPLFAVIFMRIGLREPIPGPTVISYGLAVIGVLFIMEPWAGISSWEGIITGVLAGITLGVLNFVKKFIFKGMDEGTITLKATKDDISFGLTWYATFTMMLAFSFTFFIEGSSMISWNVLSWGILLGLIPTALAFTLFNFALQGDKGGHVLIFSYAEPLIASVIGIIMDPREFSPAILIGGIMIVAGNIIISLARARAGKRGSTAITKY